MLPVITFVFCPNRSGEDRNTHKGADEVSQFFVHFSSDLYDIQHR